MTERPGVYTETTPDIPFVAQQIQELQVKEPNRWVQIAASIFDESVLAAYSEFYTLLKAKAEGKI